MEMMNVAAFQAGYFERTYQRETDVDRECLEDLFGEATFEKKLDAAVNVSQPNVDLNHWLYTCRMCLNFDVSRPYGGDLDAALSRIKCRVLAIPCKEDILHPASIVNRVVDRITRLGGNAQSYTLSSDYGHMAGILQTELYAEKVREFLK